jgi:hypothetical protein
MFKGLKEKMLVIPKGAFALPSKGDALLELAIDCFLCSFFFSSKLLWLLKNGFRSSLVSLFLGDGELNRIS